MNQITRPPKIEIIPSSAPFSEAQRSWLNGFFAGLLSDAPTPLSAEQGNDLIDIAEIVAGEDTKRISDDIVEAAARQIEVDMPGFLFRTRLVEETPGHKGRLDRIFARAAWLGCNCNCRRRGSWC